MLDLLWDIDLIVCCVWFVPQVSIFMMALELSDQKVWVFGSVRCNTFDELVFVSVIMASAFLVCIVRRGHIF